MKCRRGDVLEVGGVAASTLTSRHTPLFSSFVVLFRVLELELALCSLSSVRTFSTSVLSLWLSLLISS